jgi:membrane protein implicated in regulation of membrane protease activity
MRSSIQINGKEVRGTLPRIIVAMAILIFCGSVFLLLGSIGALLVAFASILGVTFAVLITVSIPLHYILRSMGRKGFFSRNGTDFEWTTMSAFERR